MEPEELADIVSKGFAASNLQFEEGLDFKIAQLSPQGPFLGVGPVKPVNLHPFQDDAIGGGRAVSHHKSPKMTSQRPAERNPASLPL